MNPSRRKLPSNLDLPPKKKAMIEEIWKSGQAPHAVDPPQPNQQSAVPFTRLVYHIDDLNNLYRAIPVDVDVAGFIQKKSPAYSDTRATRELVSITLMGRSDVFTVNVWIIPVFMDGVMVSQLYAADDENQALLMEHRSPIEKGEYVFSNF